MKSVWQASTRLPADSRLVAGIQQRLNLLRRKRSPGFDKVCPDRMKEHIRRQPEKGAVKQTGRCTHDASQLTPDLQLLHERLNTTVTTVVA